MNESSDRLIDEAAEQIVQREPSDALTTSVMARVNSGAPPRSGPLVWGGIAVVTAIAELVVVVSVNRARPGVVLSPPATSAQPSQIQPAVQTAAETAQNFVSDQSSVQSGPLNGRKSQSSVAQDDLVALVEPIQIEPLSPPAIEPPQEIQIEPLKIEPLSAAND